MPLENAAELGTRIHETTQRIIETRQCRSYDDEEFGLSWLPNEEIRENVLHGDDSALWGAVCWETHANAVKLNAFYKLIDKAKLLPLAAMFPGKKRWCIRGMEPNPRGMYKSAFIARPTLTGRLSRAVLVQTSESRRSVHVKAFGSTKATLEKKHLVPGLRSISYVDRIIANDVADWVIVENTRAYASVLRPLLKPKLNFRYLNRQLNVRSSCLAFAKRIDFTAVGTCAVAFATKKPMLTSNQLYQIFADEKAAIRLALWLNGTYILVHLLQRRAETRGSFSDILIDQLRCLPIPPSIIDGTAETRWRAIRNRFGTCPLQSLLDQFERPELFRSELDEALVSIIPASPQEKSRIVRELPAIYRALAEELRAMRSAMGYGDNPHEDAAGDLFPAEANDSP